MSYIIEELEGSPTFSFGHDGAEAKRTVRIAWSDIVDFSRHMIGERFPSGTGSGGALSFPGMGWLFVDKIDISPMQPDCPDGTAASPAGDVNTYASGAKCVITYKSTEGGEFDNSGNLTINLQVSAEIMTIPGVALTWASDDAPVRDDISAGKLLPTFDHSRSYKNQSSVPYSAIRNAIGKVNSEVWNGADVECALFAGCSIRGGRTKEGVVQYEIDYKYIEKTMSWNNLYRPDVGFDKVKLPDGSFLYQSTSFSGIEP